MPIDTTTLRTADGRDLCVESFGTVSGPAIIFLSGTYEGRTLYPPMIKNAHEQGLFVLGYDRPGYGGSTPKAGRVIADCASDLVAIADHFHLSRIFTLGFSGGGSHAVAAAVLLPELVAASAAMCPIRPPKTVMGATTAGNFETTFTNEKASILDADAVRVYAEKERVEILSTTDTSMIAGNLEFPAKQRVTLDFLTFHYASMKAALQPGVEGCADDLLAYYSPWGLDLSTNQVPLKIWHGKSDQTVPYAHGEWLATNTPCTELQLTETDSHRSVFENNFEEALEWLLPFK